MAEFKVIILLASRNRPDLIRDTIDSIKAQTFENWTCYITDDRSTKEVLREISSYIQDDDRFQLFSKPNSYPACLSGNRNFGLDLIADKEFDYIQFFDDDDLMHPRKLELQIAPFRENPHLNFTICKFDKLIIQADGEEKRIYPNFELDHSHLGDAILTGGLIINSLTPLWNSKIFQNYRFNNHLTYAEEWELFCRIGYHFPTNYGIVDQYLFTYRKHAGTLTLGNNNIEKIKSSLVCRQILMDYISSNNLHTPTSIKFFYKTFLLLDLKPNRVDTLISEARKIGMNRSSLQLLRFSRNIHTISYKLIGKLINLT